MGTGTSNRVLVAGLAVLVLVLGAFLTGFVGVPDLLGSTSTPEPGPGLVTAPRDDANDPWLAWIAPENVCPGSEAIDQPATDEIATMLCLINYARARERLTTLVLTPQLNWASAMKGEDIARCRRFEHAACGKAANQVVIDAGYTGSFGENLFANESAVTAPRDAIDGWLNSPEHRENLFRAEWRTAGLAAIRGAAFDSYQDAVIWVSEFGDR
jgi:uncharacterized protein YkwD